MDGSLPLTDMEEPGDPGHEAFKHFLANPPNLAQKAREENFPLGLPIHYVLDGWLVDEFPDGKIVKKKRMPDSVAICGPRTFILE